jgi:hypothetical protein
MKIWLCRIAHTLSPTDEESAAAINRLAPGECVEVEISRPRSIHWNRRYWATCAEIGRNQDPQRDKDSIDQELRVLAGHYEVMTVRDPKSGVLYEVRVPKRIAFDRMSADEWASYYQRAEAAGIERFGAEYWIETEGAQERS